MKFLIFIVFMLGFMGVAYAQMSDAQVVEAVKKAQAEGKTQNEIIVMLTQKGVTQEQVLRIKANMEKDQDTKKDQTQDTRKRNAKKYIMDRDSILMQTMLQDSVFGRSLFNNKKLTFEPNLNIATPENYKLGPGDEVIIDIWGNSEVTIRQVISPDGSINVTDLGPVYLNGKFVKEASSYLKNIFSRIYSDLGSENPGTFLKVSLGQIRSIQVNVMGEVLMPGTYTLPSLASVFHALYAAGGVNNVGTLRDVVLYRNGTALKHVDVYDYILNGNTNGDITLQDGDLISVGTYQKIVTIKGNVKRPMRYEMKPEECLVQLLEYAGGFSSYAYKKNLNVDRKGSSKHQLFTVDEGQYAQFVMEDGDMVKVDSILKKYENRVMIKGAVYRPGYYSINSSIATIKDLIGVAEGITGDAFLNRAILYRQKEDLTMEMLPVDIGQLLRGEGENLTLKKDDELYIPSKKDLREGYVIEIRGEVKNPKQYAFVDNMTLEDAVVQAGGLLESASLARVDVSRRIKSPNSTEEASNEAQLFTFTLKNGLIIDGAQGFTLEPFDEIFVRRSPGYSKQQNVSVEGEILYPGLYAKSSPNDRLSDLVKRAGGITSKAHMKGARILRLLNEAEKMSVVSEKKLMKKGEKDSIVIDSLDLGDYYAVGIDLQQALDHPGGEADLVLRAGDQLYIPYYTNTVKISGAVMYPNAVTYHKKMKLKDYVANAGGFSMNAKKRRAYVLYQNGMLAVRKGGRNPKIEPGCQIIVPVKSERKNRFGLPEIMSVATSTTSLAAMVTAILNTSK